MHCVQVIYSLNRYAQVYDSQGVKVVVVSIDSADRLNTFKLSSRHPIPFVMLADEDQEVHKRYNLENNTGYVLVDRHGVVRAKYLDLDNHIPGHTELVETIENHLDSEGVSVGVN